MIWQAREVPGLRVFDAAWQTYVGHADRSDESWLLAVHPEDRERCVAICQAAMAAGTPFMQDYRVRRHDGVYRWLMDNAVPTIDGHFTGTCIDIHRRRLAEDQLAARTQTLRLRSRRRADFVSALAHELRNPLSPIVNAASLLRILEDQQPRLTRIREIIERQADILRRLTSDMSDAMRVGSDRMPLRLETIHVGELIDRALSGVEGRIVNDGHRVIVDIPDPAVQLCGDVNRLQQALGNMLANAGKFTPDPGEIQVRVTTERQAVHIAVSDRGIGIVPDALPRVFDVWGSDHAMSRTGGGLGVGLAIARRIARLHRGDITAHSGGAGLGSSFVLTLPAQPRAR